MVGINNITQINQTTIEAVTNVTGLAELMINVNDIIFEGKLFFILLWVLWIILFLGLQSRENRVAENIMYSGAGVTVVSFLLRGVLIYENGVYSGLLTDPQLWVFPLITIITVMFVYMANRN